MRRLSLCLVVALLVVGCGDEAAERGVEGVPAPPEGSLLRSPLSPLPALLSETGLFPLAPSLRAPAVAVEYTPRYPLWTNGSQKLRHLVVPEGEVLDTSAAEAWRYPAGTLLFKTFVYAGADGVERAVETRVMRRRDDGWDYGVYQWRSGGEEADLLELVEPVSVEVEDAEQGRFVHEIPNRLQCRKCHESSERADDDGFVLGLSQLQVGYEGGGLEAMEAVMSDPVAASAPISHPDPRTEAVMAYFVGNCVHCHNGGVGGSRSFDLRPAVMLENTLNEPTDSSAFAPGIRVVPGEPEQSLLFLAVRGESPVEGVKDMPPAGVQRRDEAWVALLEAWILSLPEEDQPTLP
jgi:mono/diheme cytochrome c family protein